MTQSSLTWVFRLETSGTTQRWTNLDCTLDLLVGLIRDACPAWKTY